MGDEQKYFDFMKSTDYWGFILLFLFFAIIGITIFILDYKKRKRYSNGIADAPGKNRTYITPASKELIDISLAESNDEDILETLKNCTNRFISLLELDLTEKDFEICTTTSKNTY